MRQQRRTTGLCWLATATLIAGHGDLYRNAVAQTERPAGGQASTPIRAEVVQPVRQAVTREVVVPGTLVPYEQVDILAKASGYVDNIDLFIGDRVKKGDTLVRLAVPELADELRRAEAQLVAKGRTVDSLRAKARQALREAETAEARVKREEARSHLDEINLKRKRELFEGGAIPQQAMDEATSAHAIAEAELQIARAQAAGAIADRDAVDADIQVALSEVLVAQSEVARFRTLLEYASVQAPFDGVITARHVDHGAFVRSASEGQTAPLVTLARTDSLRVVLEIPEIDALFVRAGTPVRIDIPALHGQPFPANVTRTAAVVRPDTRTMRAEIDLDNPDGRLIPGTYARVTVEVERVAGATVIPAKAIRVAGDKTSVLVADNGTARSQAVTIGYDDGIWAEVVSGLRGDELVIISVGGDVSDGEAVVPVPSDAPRS